MTPSISRRRPGARWIAGLLLLAWLTPIALPHAAADDRLCESVASTDQSAAVAPLAATDPQPHHCVICHTARAFRTALVDCGSVPALVFANAEINVSIVLGHRAPALDRLPARAPPA